MVPLFEIFSQLVAGSLVFWPLLNSMAIIALFLYWIFFVSKLWPQDKTALSLFYFFASLYMIKIIGTFYSDDLKSAVFKLQQTSALLVLPMIYAFSIPGEKQLNRTLDFFSTCCAAGALAGISWGFVQYFKTGSLHYLQGYELVVLKGMAPYIWGLCCLTCMSWQIFRLGKDGFQKSNVFWIRISSLALFTLFLLLMGNRMSILLLFFLVLIHLIKTNFRKEYKIAAISVVLVLLLTIGMLTPKLRQQFE